jgi:multiple sugar transport system permease protein
VLLVWLVAPIVWIVIASLQTEQAMTQTPPALSARLDFGWYEYLLGHPKWIGSLGVSVTVALATTVITIFVGALTAFPLARLRIPFRNVFMGILVFTQMIPAIVMAIPVLLLFQALHLRDSVFGLVIINVAFLLPLVIWLERGYFEDVPRSIESAARIDGCSRLGTLFRITMPAAAPGIFAIAIVLLIGTWNEFLFAVVLGDKDAVTVTRRITELGVLNPQYGVAYTQLAAAGVLAVLPPLILVLLFHRRIVRGLTEGFVKG